MLNIGNMIQHYKVVSLLGKGGMGEVYKCEDQMLGRLVAIKALNTILTADSNFVQRFRREAQLQAKLSHPHIVNLYSYFEDGGQYYMVMEYAEGKTLKDLIKETGPIPEPRTLKILEQILQALEYAHSKGVVHRDIKPVNIVIGDDDQVKIMDFGIARLLGEKGLTQTGQQLGTVSYMSPEQVKAVRDIDGRSDIYSLGVTLFEMLSGRLPYNTDTDSDYEVMNQIVAVDIPDPRSYYPHISEALIHVLNKMLMKDREARYSNIHELLADLKQENTFKPEPESLDHETNAESIPETRPWVRYWARMLDSLVYGSIIGLLSAIIWPSILDMNESILGWVVLIVYIPIEALFLCWFGTTPGKALLKVSINKVDGSSFTFSQALKRSGMVWLYGLGTGFPILSLVMTILSYRNLKKNHITVWDRTLDISIKHHRIGAGRTIAYVGIIVIYVVLVTILSEM